MPGNRLLFLFLLSSFFCNKPIQGTNFFDVAQEQIQKISPKPATHKPVVEFKQAVIRYIKNTENQCLHNYPRHTDENMSYKKELRYLFNNYGKLSSTALLFRLRSAHQVMVKNELNVESDVYKRYEQLSSALLLICAQLFCNDVRDQILDALQEIDNLIMYWRYQHNHQISYFFGKSPIKWITGKEQEKEIAYNLRRLERKQAELYTLLGALIGHMHIFSESAVDYNSCYQWIQELFTIVACINISHNYNTDGTLFDALSSELELKIRHVGNVKNNFLLPLAHARKPHHFVRHWIAYTALIAVAGYTMHCSAQNPNLLPTVFKGTQDTAKYLFDLTVGPLKKIYKRLEVAFSFQVNGNMEHQLIDDKSKVIEFPKSDMDPLLIDDICNQIKIVGEDTVSEINKELAKSNTTLRQDAMAYLNEALEDVKNPKDGFMYGTKYTFDENTVNEIARNFVEVKIKPIIKDGVVINQEEIDKYRATLKNLRNTVDTLRKQTPSVSYTGLFLYAKLTAVNEMLRIANDYLDPLQIYTEIIDEKILKMIQLIAILVENLARRGDMLARHSDMLLKQAYYELKEAQAMRQDLELTLIFTALIPLIGICVGVPMIYKWATKKNYVPIRIALADVNALLIESAMQLNDHDYGKLVYLISKLRNKAKSLKHTLSSEFLADVAKLESKRYSAQIKRAIVENMFNKYVFLGRVAT